MSGFIEGEDRRRATLLELFICRYLNHVHSSRRLERQAQRNVELMWLTGRLAPDFKTIADFRKNNGAAIRLVCREFVMLCVTELSTWPTSVWQGVRRTG